MLKTAFGAALLFLLASCSKLLSPKYAGYSRLRVERVGLKNTVIAAELKLYNPNKYDLQVKSADAKIYFNGHLLGHTYFDTLIILRSKDTTYLPLQMQATAKDILTNTARVLLNRTIKVKIEGKIKAGRHGLYINVPVNYEGTQHIDFSHKDTAGASAQMKSLKRRLIGLLLQPVKTPVLILEVILAIVDLTDREAVNSRSKNKRGEGFGLNHVRSSDANFSHTQTVSSSNLQGA